MQRGLRELPCSWMLFSGRTSPAGISAAVFLGGTLLLTMWRMSRDPQHKRSKTINKNKVRALRCCCCWCTVYQRQGPCQEQVLARWCQQPKASSAAGTMPTAAPSPQPAQPDGSAPVCTSQLSRSACGSPSLHALPSRPTHWRLLATSRCQAALLASLFLAPPTKTAGSQ